MEASCSFQYFIVSTCERCVCCIRGMGMDKDAVVKTIQTKFGELPKDKMLCVCVCISVGIKCLFYGSATLSLIKVGSFCDSR